LDQALPTGPDRVEQRMVAEPWDGDAEPLGGADDQLALRRDRRDAVNSQRYVALRHRGRLVISAPALRGTVLVWNTARGHGHARAPVVVRAGAHAVDSAGSKGQLPLRRCSRYSSRKYWMEEVIGEVAPSPSAQKARPRMLSDRSSSFSRSSSLPCPASSCLSTWTSQ